MQRQSYNQGHLSKAQDQKNQNPRPYNKKQQLIILTRPAVHKWVIYQIRIRLRNILLKVHCLESKFCYFKINKTFLFTFFFFFMKADYNNNNDRNLYECIYLTERTSLQAPLDHVNNENMHMPFLMQCNM